MAGAALPRVLLVILLLTGAPAAHAHGPATDNEAPIATETFTGRRVRASRWRGSDAFPEISKAGFDPTLDGRLSRR